MSNTKLTKRKTDSTKSVSSPKNEDSKATKTEEGDDKVSPKYGPMPKVTNHRIWSRGVMIFGVIVYIWYTSKTPKETVLAKQNEVHQRRGQSFECDRNYLEEIRKFPGCEPKKCGRYVSDKIVTVTEAETLLRLAVKGLAYGGSDGGASILELHSGSLSYKDAFVNIYKLPNVKKFATATDLAVYKIVRSKIQHAIAESFGISSDRLYLTHPTFFSRLTNVPAKTPNDEYWHVHVDKETYEHFHYTSLLYLNDYGVEFKGGRFMFLDAKTQKNTTVEPRKGRVSMFTSGAENPHSVERVFEGLRYAITVSFTCDPSKAIEDPPLK